MSNLSTDDDPMYEITVGIPVQAGPETVEKIFDAVATAAYEAQPEDRGWDIFVIGVGPGHPRQGEEPAAPPKPAKPPCTCGYLEAPDHECPDHGECSFWGHPDSGDGTCHCGFVTYVEQEVL
jgi:hypothetical protein